MVDYVYELTVKNDSRIFYFMKHFRTLAVLNKIKKTNPILLNELPKFSFKMLDINLELSININEDNGSFYIILKYNNLLLRLPEFINWYNAHRNTFQEFYKYKFAIQEFQNWKFSLQDLIIFNRFKLDLNHNF